MLYYSISINIGQPNWGEFQPRNMDMFHSAMTAVWSRWGEKLGK